MISIYLFVAQDNKFKDVGFTKRSFEMDPESRFNMANKNCQMVN